MIVGTGQIAKSSSSNTVARRGSGAVSTPNLSWPLRQSGDVELDAVLLVLLGVVGRRGD